MVVYFWDILETDPNLNLLNVNITNGCYRYVILTLLEKVPSIFEPFILGSKLFHEIHRLSRNKVPESQLYISTHSNHCNNLPPVSQESGQASSLTCLDWLNFLQTETEKKFG